MKNNDGDVVMHAKLEALDPTWSEPIVMRYSSDPLPDIELFACKQKVFSKYMKHMWFMNTDMMSTGHKHKRQIESTPENEAASVSIRDGFMEISY